MSGLEKIVASFFNRPPARGTTLPLALRFHPPFHFSWSSHCLG